MARAKSSTRSKTVRAIEEIDQGIEMLRKQIAKVEDLTSEGFPYREAFRARAELQIRESIRRIFGDKSPEFQAYQHYKLRTNTPTEITETLSMLNGLIARLESKKLDLLGLGAGEPTATAPQAGTLPNVPYPTLVPPAQIADTLLAPPVAPPVAMNVATPTSVTSTSTASSAQSAPPHPAPAAAPSNLPRVQPASVASVPSSTMPPPPFPTSTTVSPAGSPAQSAHPPIQRTEIAPHPSPQPNQAAAPVSSPSPPLPGSGSLAQSATAKPHSVRTHAMLAASPVFETPPRAAEGSPTPFHSMSPSTDTAEAAPTANASSATTSRDGSEPAPTVSHRAPPSPTAKPAPTAERLVRQAEQPIPSAGRIAGRLDTPRTDATKPTPSDSPVEPDPLDLVRKICTRFHTVVRQLRLRREYRATLDVEDEYDVQDLFYALLRLEFDEVSTEEWMPPYTDCASRTTFFLQRGDIAIVVKKTRPGVGAREIADQLRTDAERYAARETCKTLFCFVYDPEGRIGNPRGLEMDLTSVSDRYTVELLVAPK